MEKKEFKLCIENVSKVFREKAGTVTALENTNFSVAESEFVTILGPSGCGKSTILRIIAGLEEASSGRVLLDGKEIRQPGKDRGMVFQAYTLFPWLTVEQNIAFGLDVAGRSKAEQRDAVNFYIEKIGLKGFEKAYPRKLSGGMKQRVAIARCPSARPYQDL